MSTFYKVHEFAALAGVTVKALYHYDRLGLLKPRRSDAGYRIYTERDLERLEQIVALKFLGLPLKQIGAVLDRTAIELPDALRLQRQALEEKQRLLAGAIQAIIDTEKAMRPGEPADPAILKKLIGAIGVLEVDTARYFSEEAMAKIRQFCERASSGQWIQEWKDLRRDVLASIGEDPTGETGRALAIRSRAQMQQNAGEFGFINDPEVMAGVKRAGADAGNWPPGLLRRIEESAGFATVVPFLRKALAALGDDTTPEFDTKSGA
jgi:DNA-binding transcriptional MerR regulator